MKPYGKGHLGILIIGEAPGEKEDKQGKPFVGRSGIFLRKMITAMGLNMDVDCIATNVVQCRPPNNRDLDPYEIQCCSARLNKQIKNFNPDVILALGSPAIREVLKDGQHLGLSATSMYGRIVPSRLRGCPVVCGFHPAYYTRHEGEYDNFMRATIKQVLTALKNPPEAKELDTSAYTVLETVDKVVATLKTLSESSTPVTIDYETTGLNPLAEGFKPLLVGLADTPSFGYVVPLEHPHARWKPNELKEVYRALKSFLRSPAPKVIQNWAYEESVSLSYHELKTGINNVVCDTMVREHILDNRAGVCGQAFQEFVRYGEVAHKQIRKDDLAHEFMDTVARYCALDVRYGLQWYYDQEREMDDDLQRAYALFHRTIPLFTRMSLRGMKVDIDKLDEIEAGVKTELAVLRPDANLECLESYRAKYGTEWQSTSSKARQRLFFDVLGLTPLKTTASGTDLSKSMHCSTDAETVTSLIKQLPDGSPEQTLLKAIKDKAHLDKLKGYVSGVRGLIDQGAIHPAFLLHVVTSYRSSSSDPNFQNFPIRVPRMAVLRKAFVPSYDWLLEMDFSGAEVRGYAINTGDKTLISHIRNNVDYHKHYAALLYEVPEEEINKEMRYKGKNGFVFPEFYGDVADNIARINPQWKKVRIREVESIFWNDLSDVKKWQNDTWELYRKNGYIQYLTGFRARMSKKGGLLSYNACCNFPNQGLAFHRLLECLLKLEAGMRAAKMKSQIIGQIHDSIVIDVVNEELDDLLAMADPIIKEPVWGFDGVVPWEAEAKIGKNFLEMHVI